MRTVVEVGGWEHECCGAAYERNTVVDITCRVVVGHDGEARRHRGSAHDLAEDGGAVHVRGRVADISIQHTDGSTEQIERLPSGRALRGFDDRDDGHLEQLGTGRAVLADSSHFLVTIAVLPTGEYWPAQHDG